MADNTVRLEAESLALANYVIENNFNASGNQLISLLNANVDTGDAGEASTASFTFAGESNTYDITIGYFDENDGVGELKLDIGDTTVDSWLLNEQTGSAGARPSSFRTRTIFGQEITNGELITMTGTASVPVGEWARIDYIELTPASVQEPNPGVLAFANADYGVTEGQASITVTVNRTGGTVGEVSAEVNLSTLLPSTASDADYTFALPVTVTFADGDDAPKTFEIIIEDDNELESAETLNLTLENVTGGATLGTVDATTITITDNDSNPGVPNPGDPIRIEAENMVLSGGYAVEGGKFFASGNAVIRSNAESGSPASAAAQFSGLAGTYKVAMRYWDEGDGIATIIVKIGSSEFNLTLDQRLGSNGISRRNIVDVTLSESLEIAANEAIEIIGIRDNGELVRVDYLDFIPVSVAPTPTPTPATIEFDSVNYDVLEGDGSISVTVVRSGGSDGEVSAQVDLGTGFTASAADYTLTTPITVTFADGDDTSQTIVIPITDDTEVEGNETLELTLGNVTGGAVVGTVAATTVTIADNDSSTVTAVRLEAEDMFLSGGYVIESGKSFASGNSVIRNDSPAGTPATATTQFSGASGFYKVAIRYWDEGDGISPITVRIGSNEFNLTLDQSLVPMALAGGISSMQRCLSRLRLIPMKR